MTTEKAVTDTQQANSWRRQRNLLGGVATALLLAVVVQLLSSPSAGPDNPGDASQPASEVVSGEPQRELASSESDRVASPAQAPSRTPSQAEEVAALEIQLAEAGEQLALSEERTRQLERSLKAATEYGFTLGRRHQEAPSMNGTKAKNTLLEKGYPEDVAEQVSLELRLSMRGVEMEESDYLWMGACMLDGSWPVANSEGEPSIQLSLIDKFGAEELVDTLGPVSMWNLIEGLTEIDMATYFGKHISRIYDIVPESYRQELLTHYPSVF